MYLIFTEGQQLFSFLGNMKIATNNQRIAFLPNYLTFKIPRNQ